MYHQKTRDLYFAALRPINRLNYWKWRAQNVRRNGASQIHLHLGCGTKRLPDFVNIDGNLFRNPDVWLDLRNGLPFPNASVHSAYASHVFEHFYPDELTRILRECYRVLLPGGGLRIVVPDMGSAVRAYLSGHQEYFPDFPRPHESLGGKLSNLLFCEGGHRQGFDFSHLKELLQEANFSEVNQLSAEESRVYSEDIFIALRREEAGVSSFSLFVECRK